MSVFFFLSMIFYRATTILALICDAFWYLIKRTQTLNNQQNKTAPSILSCYKSTFPLMNPAYRVTQKKGIHLQLQSYVTQSKFIFLDASKIKRIVLIFDRVTGLCRCHPVLVLLPYASWHSLVYYLTVVLSRS